MSFETYHPHEGGLKLQEQTDQLAAHPVMGEAAEVTIIADEHEQNMVRYREMLDDQTEFARAKIFDALNQHDYQSLRLYASMSSKLQPDTLSLIIASLEPDDFYNARVYQAPTEPEQKARIALVQRIGGEVYRYSEDELYAVGSELFEKAGIGWFVERLRSRSLPINAEATKRILMDHGQAAIVLEYAHHFENLDGEAIVAQLFAQKKSRDLARFYDVIAPFVTKTELIDHLAAEKELVYATWSSPRLFSGLSEADQKKVAAHVLADGSAYALVDILHDMPAIDPNQVAAGMIEDGVPDGFLNEDFLARINPDTYKEDLIRVNSEAYMLAKHEHYSNLDHQAMAMKAIRLGLYDVFSDRIDELVGIDKEAIYKSVLRYGSGRLLLRQEASFECFDLVEVLSKVRGFEAEDVMDLLMRHPELEREGLAALIENNQTKWLFDHGGKNETAMPLPELYAMIRDSGHLSDLLVEKPQEVMTLIGEDRLLDECLAQLDIMMTQGNEASFFELQEYLIAQLPANALPGSLKEVRRCMQATGPTLSGYRIVRSLLENEMISDAAAKMGVTRTGMAGVEQFAAACNAYKESVFDVSRLDDVATMALTSDTYMTILAKLYKVDLSSFSHVDAEQLRAAIIRDKAESNQVQPLGDGFETKRDEVMTIKSDKKVEPLTEDALARYASLHGDIVSALAALDGSRRPFEGMLTNMAVQINQEIKTLEEQRYSQPLAGVSVEKQAIMRHNLTDKINTLQGILDSAEQGEYTGRNLAVLSPHAMTELLPQLSQFKRLHPIMRQMVFAYALRQNAQSQSTMRSLPDEPTIESLSDVHEFVETIVNKQTYGDYFSDKRAARQFRELSNVEAIDAALVRHQKIAESDGQQALTFTPARGLALELSGYVGDTCWADIDEPITQSHPNITAIIMKRGDPGTAAERLIGSALFVETTDADGNAVLSLRGINPRENYINKTKVEDFYRAITTYCRETAARKGMIPSIVIDNHSGGSSTNRPVLFEYMQRMKTGSTNIVVDEASSSFNNYNVTNHTYAL